jgi:hypothetical protein
MAWGGTFRSIMGRGIGGEYRRYAGIFVERFGVLMKGRKLLLGKKENLSVQISGVSKVYQTLIAQHEVEHSREVDSRFRRDKESFQSRFPIIQ